MSNLHQSQQDVADAEAALEALGALTPANFDQAQTLLEKRKNAQVNIAQIQQNQFYNDAFNLIGKMRNAAQPDTIVVSSQFLRQFAEYIATQTQTLEKTYTTVKSIVDNIPPMGGGN